MNDPLTKYDANISECGQYRWSLHRSWDRSLPLLGWIMLNPSTADAMQDDPTIRRCMGFAKDWGYGGIEVRNLFALRATNPDALRTTRNPMGKQNDEAILGMAAICPMIVCAWGAHSFANERADAVMKLLRQSAAQIVCLRTTKLGHPRHPLYVHSLQEPIRFG